MVKNNNNIFTLNTCETSYIFRVDESGKLNHLYYGKKIENVDDARSFMDKNNFPVGNSINYDEKTVLENMCLEVSETGKGDLRQPFVKIQYGDGSTTSDFVYESCEIIDGKRELKTLPSAYGDDKVQTLIIRMNDKNYGVVLELTYSVFENENVITRSSRIINATSGEIKVLRLMSAQVDFDEYGYNMIHFNGAWAREMEMNVTPVNGTVINSSVCGNSGNRSNPFVMLADCDTVEDYGDCYGFNLVYSGNHFESAEVNGYGQTRFVAGINPETFSYVLESGEEFEAPEAVMTYSDKGFGGQSRNMHEFVRNHIVRGVWAKKERPILLNSWEAAYFDINESKLVKMAKAAKDVGIELFVMDDGWFGKRDNDKCSLGDWEANKKKLPGGVASLAKKINDLGMDFGIWVEPEMVNEDSELFRMHPDWAMRIPGKNHAVGRNQMILDLTKEEVRDYVKKAMENVFSSGNIAYVKWDMNRIFTDYYSDSLDVNRQGEVAHRYEMGLYEVMKYLTEKFPDILFEGCSAGGNRFDLGILCYMPQIWASDDTDATERCRIQTGYSYGYPMSVVSAHVSGCPNHQTLRNTPIETRFNVACFGVLGYECNLMEMTDAELNAVKDQIELYKQHRSTLQFGDYYRIKNGVTDIWKKNVYQWITVSKDKTDAIAFYYQDRAIPNYGDGRIKTKGLENKYTYSFKNREFKYDVRLFGDLINAVAPFHIKKDSLVHNTIARFVKMDGEKEEYSVSGELLNNAGIKLRPKYAGCGFDGDTAYFQDYCSRIYLIEKI